MDEIQKTEKLNLYFITSIEKEYYNSRNLDYINQSKTIENFKYKEIFSEEVQIKDKVYLNKLNSISFDLPEKGTFKSNSIFCSFILSLFGVGGRSLCPKI